MLHIQGLSAVHGRRRFTRPVAFTAILATVCALLGGRTAVAQNDAAATASRPIAIAELIPQARERFTPPSDEQLEAARSELAERMDALARFVRPQSANGQKWLKYLQREALDAALAAEGPIDLAPLAATYQRLNRNENGLELAPFRRVSDALRQFIDLSAVAQMEDPAVVYNRQLEALAGELERLRAAHREGTGAGNDAASLLEYSIGGRLDFLAGMGQATELIAAIRDEFAEPNAFMTISVELVRAAAEEPIDRNDPVSDVILGTRINGTGHTTGSITVRAAPSDDAATIELSTEGHTVSQNVGRNGPAVIRTTGYTDFTATKQVEFSDAEFRSPPAAVEAKTTSDIHSVRKAGGGIGSGRVASEGMSRARQSQSRANAISADHAEDRIRQRIDEEVGDKLRDGRKRYEDTYRDPLARHGDLPDHILFRTTSDDVIIEATQANRGQLAASTPPPALPPDRDVVVRLHESAVSNYWATFLGGATASETEPGQDGAKFDVKLPQWMKDAWQRKKTDQEQGAEAGDAPFKSWSLTFRHVRPLSVDFADNQMRLTIHLARLVSGDDEFTNWDVTGVFTPQLQNGGAVLRRDGELIVLPTGFDTERGQLSSRQVAVRSNLSSVLNERSAQGRGFPSQIEFAELEPTGALEKVGPLALTELKSGGGWITLAWNRQ